MIYTNVLTFTGANYLGELRENVFLHSLISMSLLSYFIASTLKEADTFKHGKCVTINLIINDITISNDKIYKYLTRKEISLTEIFARFVPIFWSLTESKAGGCDHGVIIFCLFSSIPYLLTNCAWVWHLSHYIRESNTIQAVEIYPQINSLFLDHPNQYYIK